MEEKIVKYLVLENGECLFEDWFSSLKDKILQYSVDARLARVRAGNLGDYKSLGDGVYELRIVKGPGLRIYFGFDGLTVIIIISGGDKGSQVKDIRRAKELWAIYQR
jgi:putative addiction module killer protein